MASLVFQRTIPVIGRTDWSVDWRGMGFIPESSQGPRDSDKIISPKLAVQKRAFESCIEGKFVFVFGDFLNQLTFG